MLNKVYTQFRAPVNSLPLGEMNLGLMKPGRYSGFDTITGSTLAITLKHSGRIKKSTGNVEGVITEKTFGSLLFPNGCVLHSENESVNDGINLIIDNNIGNANPRYDLIVCEQEYVQIEGGQPPYFFIQKGNNSGVIPTLAIPKKQVIVGMVTIAPQGSAFYNLTYTKSPVPIIGDNTPAELLTFLGVDSLLLAKEDKTTVAAINERLVLLELKNAVFQSGGGMIFWNKPLIEIPLGWAEVVNWRGRFPVGLLLNDLDFGVLGGIGGSKTHTLITEELPEHSHGLPVDGGGVTDMQSLGVSGGNDEGYSVDQQSALTGEGAPFSILNPYRVVIFIEWVGLPPVNP